MLGGRNYLKRLTISYFRREKWYVAIREKQPGVLSTNQRFIRLKNPMRGWVADPFVFSYAGVDYVCAEMWDYSKERGTIAYGVIDDESICVKKWNQVIVEDFHLSFPFIYTCGEAIYIIPESSASGNLIRYRAERFPDVL